jgi:malate synthase
MNKRVDQCGLSIDSALFELVESEICPGTGVSIEQFWLGLANIVEELGPVNKVHLTLRDTLQSSLDSWHK